MATLSTHIFEGRLKDGQSPTVEDLSEWLYDSFGWNIQQARDYALAVAGTTTLRVPQQKKCSNGEVLPCNCTMH